MAETTVRRDGRPPSCRFGAGVCGALPARHRPERRGYDPLSCVQLDSISTVERSHRIALTGRVGDYPQEAVSRLLARGRIFEYWAHEACLLPIESWPLFRRAMENGGRGWYGAVGKTHPHLADEILAEIRERGSLASRHFEGATGGGCGTGSRRRRCSSGSGTTATS